MARSSANSASSLRCCCCDGSLGFSAPVEISCGHSQLELGRVGRVHPIRPPSARSERGRRRVIGPCSSRTHWSMRESYKVTLFSTPDHFVLFPWFCPRGVLSSYSRQWP